MKNKYKIIATLLILLPTVSLAAGIIPSDAEISQSGFCAFANMVNTIIIRILQLSGSIAAITFSIAGGKILFNPSNPAKIQEGQEMLRKTVIGMLVILGAWLIVHTIVGAVINPQIGALRFLGDACK